MHINYAKRFPKTQFEIHDTLDAISHATCGMAIDIGAKVEVYNIINEIAAAGKCVIVISSEMTELMGICDRIVVMCRGTITGEERKGQFTQESLMYLATGGSAAV